MMKKNTKDITAFIRSDLAVLPGFSHAYPTIQLDGRTVIEAWFVREPPEEMPAEFDGIRIRAFSAESLLEAQW